MPDTPVTRTGTTTSLGDVFRPLDGDQLKDPYPFYARARDEQPVFFSPPIGAWVVTRYEDVRDILMRPETFSSRDTIRPVAEFSPRTLKVLSEGYGFVPTITNTDGSEHRRFRVPLQHVFRPARMRAIEEPVRSAATRLLAGLAARGEMDLVTDFAAPLALTGLVQICGFPAEDTETVVSWFNDVKALTMSPLDEERQVACARSFVAAQHYVADLVERRQPAPGDDLIGSLIAVRADESAPLSTAEIVNTTVGTMLAGHETTAALITNAMVTLLSTPALWADACEQPGTVPGLLEEALRFDSPVPVFIRTALQDTHVGETAIPKDALVLVSFASANRDPRQFPSPDSYFPSRSPNPHLAFGRGVHTCVGAALARLEGRIALHALTSLPGLRLKPRQEPRYVPTLQFRSLASLPVEWDT